MSIKIMATIWDDERIERRDKLVALALADHADDEGRCYPSIDRIAKKAGLSRRSAIYSLERLEQAGVVGVEHNAGPQGTNVYTIGGCKDCTGAKSARVQNTDLKLHPNRKEPSGIQTTSRARDIPPSAEAVLAYAEEQGAAVHAAAFHDHFEACGWKLNSGRGSLMKDWRAAFRNWVRNVPNFQRDNGKATGKLSARQYAGLSYREKLERAARG